MFQSATKKTIASFVIAVTLSLMAMLAVRVESADAACPAQDTSRGTVTSTFNVPQTGTYTVWSRIMAEGTNDAYTLEIDGTTCGIVVGNANNNATGWKWINYRDGNANSKITVNLTAGSHTMTMIGREDGVKLDRVMFLSNPDCIPDDATKGDNCVEVLDTTLPTATVTKPTNNASITGTTVIEATATDNVGVKRVDFYMGSTLVGNDTSSPYTYALNTTPYPPGNYQISARAVDTSDNVSAASTVNVTIPQPADTQAPVVTLSSPLGGQTVSGPVTVSANATDNVRVAKVEILVDGVVKQTLTTAPYTYVLDSTTVADGSHTIAAKAYDPSNLSSTASVTVTVKNTSAAVKCDFNGDGRVHLVDLSVLLSNYRGPAVPPNTKGDCDGNGTVDLLDLSALLSKYGL